ncbi:MAG: type I methionyl aminopeptidase [Elusimicrobiota bacterium]
MIEIKTEEEIKSIRLACRAVAATLLEVKEKLKAGMSTLDIDRLAASTLEKLKAKPAFLGYRGYPATACVSVNEEVIHGIPSARKIIKEGDIVSVDMGAIVNGFYGDAAVTVAVGAISSGEKVLLEITEKALYEGLKFARSGARLGDISSAVEKTASSAGLGVVREFTGHGIGRRLHEEPSIPNYGIPGTGPMLRTGMTLAIEPMLCMGSEEVKFLKDGWTVVTADSSKSAHFEHTVLVKEGECEILTRL